MRGLGWRVAGAQREVAAQATDEWLVPVYLAAAVIAVVWTYYMYGSMVAWFMDNQMHVLADSQRGGVRSAGVSAADRYNVEKGDMVVQIWDRQSGLADQLLARARGAAQAADGFEDVKVGSQRWRVYTVQSPDRTVQSMQSLEFRAHRQQAGVAGGLADRADDSDLGMASVVRLARDGRARDCRASRGRAGREHIVELPTQGRSFRDQPLVLAVNTLLARLRDAFASQRRFVQDAAHELRTPITAMSCSWRI